MAYIQLMTKKRMMIEESKEITREYIQEELVAIINQTVIDGNVFHDDEYDDIDDNTNINETWYDLDDFDTVEIILELEQAFDIEIPDSDVFIFEHGNFGFTFKFKTIGEFTDYLLNKIKSKQ